MAVRPDASKKSAAPIPVEEDLEQYGVWVKAEPHDIIEETGPASRSSTDSPTDVDESADFSIPNEEEFLSEDEEKFLGSFGDIDVQEGNKEAISEKETDNSIPDIDNLPPLEDFAIKEEPMNDIEDLGTSTIDISLDDLEKVAEMPSFRPDAEIDISTIRGLSGKEPEAKEAAEAEEPSSGPVIEDVSAEFLDFEESEEPQASSPHEENFEEPAAEPEFESIDMDLHFDDTIPTASGSGSQDSGHEPGFEEVSDFDDFLKEEPAKKEFDDLAAVERDLSSGEAPSSGASGTASPKEAESLRERSPSAEESGAAKLSNELLLKIAEELSSIRGELVTLKSQISSFKLGEAPAPCKEEEEAPPSLAASTEKAAPSHTMGGFFDEEEDETIALTGDELDNILNTADFTEENVVIEEGISLEPSAEELSLEGILPETGDYSAPAAEMEPQEETPIEEIRIEPSEEAALPSFEEEETEMESLPEEEINHLTQAPEDTSYLEEPLPNEEPLDLSEPSMGQDSLAESEPFSLDLENEELEPVPEISEELPVVEGAPEIEELSDLTLGMKAKEDYLPTGVEEALPIETVPEFEETSFGEISLAEESTIEAPAAAEEIEEISLVEEELEPLAVEELGDIETEIEEKTVKPSEPVALHPDEIPTSLDDSFFLSPVEETAEEIEEEKVEAVEEAVEEAVLAESPAAEVAEPEPSRELPKANDNDRLKGEIKGVLSYLDKLLESLPEEKIEEFARSEYFDTYKKLFEELGLV